MLTCLWPVNSQSHADVSLTNHWLTAACVIVAVQSYIAKENERGIDRSRIVVGGMSQGGAVTLYSTFAIEQEPLAGIIALSTWLPLHTAFPAVSLIRVIFSRFSWLLSSRPLFAVFSTSHGWLQCLTSHSIIYAECSVAYRYLNTRSKLIGHWVPATFTAPSRMVLSLTPYDLPFPQNGVQNAPVGTNFATGKITVGLVSHWPCITDLVV